MLASKNVYIDTKDKLCQFKLNQELHKLVSNTNKEYKKIAVVAIGTDRSTGDCFGPLVGHMLSRYSIFDFDLYGTIHKPVHALNIVETVDNIDTSGMLVIAVDASIGDINHVGYIEVSNRPIKPGSGVGKDLPPVGDIALSGIVTMAGLGALSSIMLQSTSLGLVYKMAEIASKSIIHILYKQQLELKRSKKRIISTAG